MSNLRQIGLGLMQYTQDYDEKFTPAIRGTWRSRPENYEVDTNPARPSGYFLVNDQGASPQTKNFVTWMDLIFPYVKSVPVFVCPSQKEVKTNPSYGYNRLISQVSAGGYGISLSQIQRPAEIVVIMDYPIMTGLSAAQEYCGLFVTTESYHNRVWPHLGGGTVNFADGHAKWYPRGSRSVCVVGAALDAQPAWNPLTP